MWYRPPRVRRSGVSEGAAQGPSEGAEPCDPRRLSWTESPWPRSIALRAGGAPCPREQRGVLLGYQRCLGNAGGEPAFPSLRGPSIYSGFSPGFLPLFMPLKEILSHLLFGAHENSCIKTEVITRNV